MKKIFLLIFTAIIIFSCNNSPNLKETQSDKITEEEKVKFKKIQNMSPSLEILKTINPYDDVFSEYDYKYSMYFRIKRGEKEEFFIPSEINIRELVEKYPVTPMEKNILK